MSIRMLLYPDLFSKLFWEDIKVYKTFTKESYMNFFLKYLSAVWWDYRVFPNVWGSESLPFVLFSWNAFSSTCVLKNLKEPKTPDDMVV